MLINKNDKTKKWLIFWSPLTGAVCTAWCKLSFLQVHFRCQRSQFLDAQSAESWPQSQAKRNGADIVAWISQAMMQLTKHEATGWASISGALKCSHEKPNIYFGTSKYKDHAVAPIVAQAERAHYTSQKLTPCWEFPTPPGLWHIPSFARAWDMLSAWSQAAVQASANTHQLQLPHAFWRTSKPDPGNMPQLFPKLLVFQSVTAATSGSHIVTDKCHRYGSTCSKATEVKYIHQIIK